MTRRYDDAIDVRRRDQEPAEFVWRGRLYLVRAVLTSWMEAGEWWQEPSVETSEAGPALSVHDREREMWRVEARAGRACESGVYDLCFDERAGTWTLASALD